MTSHDHHPVSDATTKGSLLEGLDAGSGGVGGPGARGARPSLRERFDVDLRDLLPAIRGAMEKHRALAAATGIAIALLGVGSGGALAWSAFRPIRVPDAANDPLANVLGFALLDKDFRRLPVKERLEIVLQLAERLRTMSAGDSVLVAAFAAGIAGEARKQLEENMRTLGIDMMADYAGRYARVPDAEREAFLDATALEWSRLLEQLTGQQRNVDEETRLQEMRTQAQRDAEQGRRRDGPLQAANVADFFTSMQADINNDANPNQRAQTAKFMRDMTRHLRGRDVRTNQPVRK